MKIMRILNMVMMLMVLNHFSTLAQSTEEILEFHQSKKYEIELPCRGLAAGIDAIYHKQDTLFIKIIDDRIMSLDSGSGHGHHQTLSISGDFYRFKSKMRRIPITFPTPQYEYQFIALHVYDHIYRFAKNNGIFVMTGVTTVNEYSSYMIEYTNPIPKCPAYKSSKQGRKIKNRE